MPHKTYFCIECNEEREAVLKSTNIVHEIKGESIEINVEVPHCVICGTPLSDLDIEESHFMQALNEYRRRRQLLLSEEIKAIRELYGLSQRAFARALGFAEATINRYESGAVQDDVHNTLLLLAREPNIFLVIATQNARNLSEGELSSIREAVSGLIAVRNRQDAVNCQDEQEQVDLPSRQLLANQKLELMLLGLYKKMEDIENRVNLALNQSGFAANYKFKYDWTDRLSGALLGQDEYIASEINDPYMTFGRPIKEWK